MLRCVVLYNINMTCEALNFFFKSKCEIDPKFLVGQGVIWILRPSKDRHWR